MLTEPISTEVFVKQAFESLQVSALVSDWMVDFDELRGVISRNLREMGIFQVRPNQAETVITAIVEQLRWSPDVKRLIERAEAIEKQRLRTRHSEV